MLSTLFNTPFDTLTREMDRAFERPIAGAPARRFVGLNAWRDGDDIVVEAEVPGFGMDELHVAFERGALTIRGEREAATPENARTLRRERTISRFERSLRIPVDIDADAIGATLENGVLRVSLPVAEAAKPRRIEVKAIDGPGERALPEGQKQQN